MKACREKTPNAQLKGICKVSLKSGESKEVSIKLPLEAFALYDEEAVNRVAAGEYLVSVGGSQPDKRSVELTGRKPEEFRVKAEKEYIL